MIKCICFDLDNTLYPESSYYEFCYAEIAKLISPSNAETLKNQMIEIRMKKGDTNVFQEIIKLYNLDNKFLKKFVEIYRSCKAEIDLYPDVKYYLNTINYDTRKYGVLTNGGKYTQRNKLKCLKLENKFDFVFITGEHLPRNEWKPSNKAFELITNHVEYEPSECIYIGDSIQNDVIGSLNAGMHAILVDRKSPFEERYFNNKKYWVINNFDQINYVLQEIEDDYV